MKRITSLLAVFLITLAASGAIRDEAALASQLTDEIKALVPGEDVTILIDHNYSE